MFVSVWFLPVFRCGLRAGYMELVNVDPDVMLFAETLFCCDICAPVPGQLALEVMVRPPEPGEVSYGTYKQVTWSHAWQLHHKQTSI